MPNLRKLTYISFFFFLFILVACDSISANEPVDISIESYIANEQADWVLVDVRTPEEYAAGHLPNAINLPLQSLPENHSILADKKQKIVVYCRSGKRAGQALEFLDKQGYTSLLHLEGDYLEWSSRDLPVIKPE